MEQLVYNVTTRFSKAYKAFYEIFGADALLDVIANVELDYRPDYQDLVNQYSGMVKIRGSDFFAHWYK